MLLLRIDCLLSNCFCLDKNNLISLSNSLFLEINTAFASELCSSCESKSDAIISAFF